MKPRESWSAGGEADLALLDRCKAAIRQVDPSAEVILYGSRARGDASEASDYDVLALVDGPVDVRSEDAIRESLFPLQIEANAVITLIAFSRDEWDTPLHRAVPFHRNVEREGVVL